MVLRAHVSLCVCTKAPGLTIEVVEFSINQLGKDRGEVKLVP